MKNIVIIIGIFALFASGCKKANKTETHKTSEVSENLPIDTFNNETKYIGEIPINAIESLGIGFREK